MADHDDTERLIEAAERADLARVTAERDEARTGCTLARHEATRAWAERDALAASLATLREAADTLVECVDAIDGDALRYGLGPALDAADTVRNLAAV